MKRAIQSSTRIVLFNLVPVLMIIVNAIDIEAATYYVSTSGNDTNSCAKAQGMGTSAKRTVSTGLACLSAGDTLRVQAGTYTTLSDRINNQTNPFPGGTTANNPTIIECETPLACTIDYPGDSGNYPIYLLNISNVTIRNFVIDGNDTTWQLAKIDGPCDGCDSITISGNEFHHSQVNAILAINSATNIKILNNIIHDNSHTGASGLPALSNHGYGCYCDAPGMLIEGNSFYSNADFALHYYPGKGNGAIIRNNVFHDNDKEACATDIVIYGSNHLIYNNVFYNTPGGGIRVEGSGDQIYNNTFYNEGNGCGDIQASIWVRAGTNSHAIKNNLILNARNAIINSASVSTISYNNTPNAIVDFGSGNIISNNISSGTTSSIFMDVSTGDFTLKAGSTPIDAGETISFIKTDRVGMPRPYGSAYDIGAYEFQGTSVTSIAPPSNLRVVP